MPCQHVVKPLIMQQHVSRRDLLCVLKAFIESSPPATLFGVERLDVLLLHLNCTYIQLELHPDRPRWQSCHCEEREQDFNVFNSDCGRPSGWVTKSRVANLHCKFAAWSLGLVIFCSAPRSVWSDSHSASWRGNTNKKKGYRSLAHCYFSFRRVFSSSRTPAVLKCVASQHKVMCVNQSKPTEKDSVLLKA